MTVTGGFGVSICSYALKGGKCVEHRITSEATSSQQTISCHLEQNDKPAQLKHPPISPPKKTRKQSAPNSPNPPATPTLHQAMATSPPGGRCAAVPRGAMDDMTGSGSPVRAFRGGVSGARRRGGGGRATAGGGGDAGTEEAEHCCWVVGCVVGF